MDGWPETASGCQLSGPGARRRSRSFHCTMQKRGLYFSKLIACQGEPLMTQHPGADPPLPFLPALSSPPACTLHPSPIPLLITSSLQLDQLRPICSEDLKTILILDLIMVKTILVFALVVFDSILILNLVMPKINSISVVWCGVILKILCKFQSIV